MLPVASTLLLVWTGPYVRVTWHHVCDGATENAGVENARKASMESHTFTTLTTQDERCKNASFLMYILDVSYRLIYNEMWCLWPVIYGKIIDSTYYVLSHQHSMRNTSVNKNSHMSLCSLVRRLKQTQHHLDIRATQWASDLCAVGFRSYAGKYVVFLWLLVYHARTGSLSLSSTFGKTWLLGLYRVYRMFSGS